MGKVLDPVGRRELVGYPGGMMLELGCHLIDLTVGVLGKPDRVTGFARHSSPQPDGLADNMLTVQAAVLEASGLPLDR
jgi:predicted dehydrogenase